MLLTERIRTDARWVSERARHVRMDDGALGSMADSLAEQPEPSWDTEVHFFDGTAKSAAYLLLLDAMNFCFWPSAFAVELHGRRYGDADGYLGLAAALTRAFERGIPLWDPAALREMTFGDFSALFSGDGELPLLRERHRNAMDVANVLLSRYDGAVEGLLDAARDDAPGLAAILARDFSSYDDRRRYEGREIAVFKRAQLFVSDLAGAFGGSGPGDLARLDELTCFADYKLPQLFRSRGVFVYAKPLDAAIRSGEVLPEGSPAEVEIRCSTIVAVEEIRDRLARRGRPLSPRVIDWMLWNESVRPGAVQEPHHRTLTTSY